MMKDKYELKVIGKIVSPIDDTAEMPLQGVEAQAHIEPKFTDALDGIDKHSHIFVLCWMDKARRDRLKVIPRRHGGKNKAKGVFALRSPSRPNPVSLNTTKLLKREGNILYLENIDMVNGTPIIDIKPYSTGWDCLFAAHNNSGYDNYSKMEAEDVLADMLRQAGNFHGDRCVGVAIGVRAAYLALKHFKSDLQDKGFTIDARVRGCTADALQSLFSMSNKRFKHGELEDKIIFAKGDTRLKLEITKDKFRSVEAVLAAPDEKVFSRIGD